MVMEVKPMEAKKSQQAVTPVVPKDREISAKEAARWSPREFVGGIKEELQKINWTSPEELKVYTQIVVVTTFLFGMGIYFVDLLIQICLNGLGMIARLFAG